MLHSLLKTEGLVINKKRTYRLYTEEGLQVRTKKRKKLTRPRQPLELPTEVNQRWFRTLNEARYEIDLWRDHYNKVRPHNALGYVPPEEFAKRAA